MNRLRRHLPALLAGAFFAAAANAVHAQVSETNGVMRIEAEVT
jgi:hypothetical protein